MTYHSVKLLYHQARRNVGRARG